jgi:hypothetical protein
MTMYIEYFSLLSFPSVDVLIYRVFISYLYYARIDTVAPNEAENTILAPCLRDFVTELHPLILQDRNARNA